ncbi:hypothetical protein C8R42DRAFT_637499 [Lentinula raphanica]|nr:hypothetical protein C8R42DRAFT_637499 [Lentinula raphanica]
MAKEHQFAWLFRPNLVFSGVPRNTSEDNPIPPSHLANPSLDDPAEMHALWLLVHGDPVNFPGVLCTQSGHVDLVTVRVHLLLRQLLKGIVGEQATYMERQRIIKRNFTSHFLDIAAIPYFYRQKLTELGLVTEQHISFKTSTAECGVSADNMDKAYYWGQQAVLDFMQKHDLGTKEYLSSEWDMKDIIAKKRCRIIQYEYDQQRVRGDDHWHFVRNGITRRNQRSSCDSYIVSRGLGQLSQDKLVLLRKIELQYRSINLIRLVWHLLHAWGGHQSAKQGVAGQCWTVPRHYAVPHCPALYTAGSAGGEPSGFADALGMFQCQLRPALGENDEMMIFKVETIQKVEYVVQR